MFIFVYHLVVPSFCLCLFWETLFNDSILCKDSTTVVTDLTVKHLSKCHAVAGDAESTLANKHKHKFICGGWRSIVAAILKDSNLSFEKNMLMGSCSIQMKSFLTFKKCIKDNGVGLESWEVYSHARRGWTVSCSQCKICKMTTFYFKTAGNRMQSLINSLNYFCILCHKQVFRKCWAMLLSVLESVFMLTA